MIDPFAAQPEPAAEIHVNSIEDALEAKAVGTAYIDVKPRIADGFPSENKVTVTLKGGRDFDAPWIVIHAASVAEADAQFDSGLASLMEKVQRAGAHFAGQAPKPAPGAPTQAAVRSAPPQGATDAPSWAPPKPFDDFVYKTGVSAKNGKTWHAWMPPSKGDSRDAKFFYQN